MATKKARSGRTPLDVTPDLAASSLRSAPVIASAADLLTPTDSKARGTGTMNDMMRTSEGMTSFSQGNIEAIMQSGRVWSAGVQALSQSMAASAQARFDHAMATWKALSGVKSVREVLDLQTGLARKSFETALADTGKLTEASLKLTEQTMAPLTARLTVAMDKFSQQGR
jgi:phasin family protein